MTYLTRLLLLTTVLCAAVALAAPAGAIVPPRDCKFMTVKGKRYNIKADQLRCSTARRYAERYLRSSSKVPRYYKCAKYRSGALAFVCRATRYRPDREFRAIRRS